LFVVKGSWLGSCLVVIAARTTVKLRERIAGNNRGVGLGQQGQVDHFLYQQYKVMNNFGLIFKSYRIFLADVVFFPKFAQ